MLPFNTPRDNSKRKRYNEQEATSIAFWIEEVIDEDLEFPEDIMASLRSGIDLCRLVNELQPGIVSVINEDKNVFAHTENIKAYLNACHLLGVGAADMFEIQDLLQNGDVQQVLRNIVALERACTARGYTGQRIQLEDKCEREDCANKLDALLGEIGALKRQLQDKEEDNTELRQENHDLAEKVLGKDQELAQLKVKASTLETSNGALNEKYKLVMIDMQIVKQDCEQIRRQFENLKIAHESGNTSYVIMSRPDEMKAARRASMSVGPRYTDLKSSPIPRISTSTDGVKRTSMMHLFKKTTSSPDLKKLEEMKKFIKKEKKELLRQEKEKKKREAKQEEEAAAAAAVITETTGTSEEDRPRLSKALRSITQGKFIKSKEKRFTLGKDKLPQLDAKEPAQSPPTDKMRTSKSEIMREPRTISANNLNTSLSPRERSNTAAGRLISFFKPHVNTEGNKTSTTVIIS